MVLLHCIYQLWTAMLMFVVFWLSPKLIYIQNQSKTSSLNLFFQNAWRKFHFCLKHFNLRHSAMVPLRCIRRLTTVTSKSVVFWLIPMLIWIQNPSKTSSFECIFENACRVECICSDVNIFNSRYSALILFHCIIRRTTVTLKFVVYSWSPKQIYMQVTRKSTVHNLNFENWCRICFLFCTVWLPVFRGGSTPLHQSSYSGHVEICRFLAESKADLHAKDGQDFHPLNTFLEMHTELFFLLWTF